MNTESVAERTRVLELFEQCRAAPGTQFDEAHFLDYLLPNPKGRHAVYNSFSGLRRFNRFIDAVQLEYSICFSLKDREANYSVDAFVDRLVELRRSRRSSLASLRNQERHGFGWGAVVILNFLALAVCTLAYRYVPLLGALLLGGLAVVDVRVLRFYLRERSYAKRLRTQIEATSQNDA